MIGTRAATFRHQLHSQWRRTLATSSPNSGVSAPRRGLLMQQNASRTTAGAATPAQAQAPSAQHVSSAVPTTYKRLVAAATGGSFREVAQVVDMPMMAPGPGEVLLQMLYAGINGGCETFRVRGEHAFAGNAGQRGFLLGAEGSGRVVAVGPDVSGLQVGDVVACNTAAAFTQYAVAKAVMCTPVPAEAAREAVALTLSALTACAALEVTGGMAAGETVAVTAAAGGTGHFAVQLAKLAGCRVIAFCGSDHKISVLKDLGADVVINYRSQDVDALLTQHAPGGLDLVYEGVGGQLQRTLLRHLAPNARVLQVGYISEYPHTTAADAAASRGEAASDACSAPAAAAAAGSSGASGAGEGAAAAAAASLPPNADLFWRGMSVDLGDGKRVIGQVWPRDVDAIRSSKRRVFDLHRQGKLKALIDESATFQGVEAVPDAVEHMLRGGHVGKVVVRLSPA